MEVLADLSIEHPFMGRDELENLRNLSLDYKSWDTLTQGSRTVVRERDEKQD